MSRALLHLFFPGLISEVLFILGGLCEGSPNVIELEVGNSVGLNEIQLTSCLCPRGSKW